VKIPRILVLSLLLGGMLFHITGSRLRADYSTELTANTRLTVMGLIRSWFLDDQRLQWSGTEISFGAESVLGFRLETTAGKSRIIADAEITLNQPLNRNILADESRQKYLQNFTVPPMEVRQLNLRLEGRNYSLALGERRTPFGRNFTEPFSNSFFAYPFIRNEVIVKYETGLFFELTPGILRLSLAVVNGCQDLDTNSSKAGILRLGFAAGGVEAGVSVKAQDGIGSEWQKQYSNHLGMDLSFKTGSWLFFGEIIYDQYGFHKEFETEDVFWGRSYYYRDVFLGTKTPVEGWGGYLGFRYRIDRFLLTAHYGEYHPEQIGHPYHDDPIRRLVVKSRVQLISGLAIYGAGLIENQRETEPLFAGASPYGFLLGLWFNL
jgi:hypothetical protein